MTANRMVYALSKVIQRRIIANRRKNGRDTSGDVITCGRCRVALELGELVFSKSATHTKSSNTYKKLYHIDCAKQVNLI